MPNGVGFYYWSGTNWLFIMNNGTTGVSGSGTSNYMARWTAPAALGTGVAQDNGSGVSISSTALTPANMLDVNGSAAFGTYAGTAAPANSMIVSGQMGIGTIAPNASAALDITSTTGGLLPPRISGANIALIASPATGLTVLNTTTNCLEYYNGTAWQMLVCPCTGVPNAGSITGSATPCQSSTGNVYSITAVAGAVYYTWTVPTGATITAGQNTTSVTVTMGTTNGNVTVTASNSCGTGAPQSLAITLSTPLSNPATPSGTTTPTISTANTYTIAAVTGATSYTWSTSNTNLGTVTAGQGTTSATITSTATAGTYTICIYATNACGNSATECLTVTSSSCVITHSTYSQSTAGSYTWTVPCGITTVTITLNGAEGGLYYATSNTGIPGYGATVNCVLNVSSIASLNIYLGAAGGNAASDQIGGTAGSGGNAGDEAGGAGYGNTYTQWAYTYGYGAGGGGGGASSIRVGGTTQAFEYISAGGGGGASYFGAGGGGGQPGAAGAGDGGCGAGAAGGNGTGGVAVICNSGACTTSSSAGPETYVAAGNGGTGVGGAGGMSFDANCYNTGGGGGGGGSGGGAGGDGAGGGGGYSYTGGPGVSAVTVTPDNNAAGGSITITY